jgi:hypothetical protein
MMLTASRIMLREVLNWNVRMTTEQIELLKWPQDRKELAQLSITGLQTWYVAQDMTQMVFLGQNREFKRFIYWHYSVPVKLLRLYYKMKRIFNG